MATRSPCATAIARCLVPRCSTGRCYTQEYVSVMVTNRQTVKHVREALVELLGDEHAAEFATWCVAGGAAAAVPPTTARAVATACQR